MSNSTVYNIDGGYVVWVMSELNHWANKFSYSYSTMQNHYVTDKNYNRRRGGRGVRGVMYLIIYQWIQRLQLVESVLSSRMKCQEEYD